MESLGRREPYACRIQRHKRVDGFSMAIPTSVAELELSPSQNRHGFCFCLLLLASLTAQALDPPLLVVDDDALFEEPQIQTLNPHWSSLPILYSLGNPQQVHSNPPQTCSECPAHHFQSVDQHQEHNATTKSLDFRSQAPTPLQVPVLKDGIFPKILKELLLPRGFLLHEGLENEFEALAAAAAKIGVEDGRKQPIIPQR